jgi:ppGpp synthetase/RelA/SpoT-type nucleotidyltranferase
MIIKGMEWAKPENSKNQIDKAGKIIVSDCDKSSAQYSDALSIVNNWRASHNYPLNTFKVTLRTYASSIDDGFLVAQRIKRLSSIEHKLIRFPQMNLSRMQDLGGCRAILSNASDVHKLVKKYEDSDIKHALDDIDDYISAPKTSGYRGVHLIYKYFSDKTDLYNGLSIEIQIRSRKQHAWATAVETVGTLRKEALKSSIGEDKWLRFFQLMGSVIALDEKSGALIPNTPDSKPSLIRELRSIEREINASRTLEVFQNALTIAPQESGRNDHFFLLKLNPDEKTINIERFMKNQSELATNRYLEAEKELSLIPSAEVVLVSVDSISNLKKAYPNYFLDTQVFIGLLKGALSN